MRFSIITRRRRWTSSSMATDVSPFLWPVAARAASSALRNSWLADKDGDHVVHPVQRQFRDNALRPLTDQEATLALPQMGKGIPFAFGPFQHGDVILLGGTIDREADLRRVLFDQYRADVRGLQLARPLGQKDEGPAE